jgi:hypothetical protein
MDITGQVKRRETQRELAILVRAHLLDAQLAFDTGSTDNNNSLAGVILEVQDHLQAALILSNAILEIQKQITAVPLRG